MVNEELENGLRVWSQPRKILENTGFGDIRRTIRLRPGMRSRQGEVSGVQPRRSTHQAGMLDAQAAVHHHLDAGALRPPGGVGMHDAKL